MEHFDKNKYERAKKRMEEIKGFYSHLTVYLVVNIILLLLNLGIFRNGLVNIRFPEWSMFTTPFFWGIGLLGHYLYVFQYKLQFFKDWEERKIQEYMEEEENELNQWK